MFRLALLLVCALSTWTASAMRADRLAELRQATVDVFYHGWRNYMDKAFPEDEVGSEECVALLGLIPHVSSVRCRARRSRETATPANLA